MTRPCQSGARLISWSQTEIDGRAYAPQTEIAVGAYWRWSGATVDFTVATDLGDWEGREDDVSFRRRAALAAHDVVQQALGRSSKDRALKTDHHFTVSDGRHSWIATLIEAPDLARPLIMFVGDAPPAGLPLRINKVEKRPAMQRGPGRAGVVCFTPGTWLETPGGARQIENLSAGDKIITADSGPQEILWIGARHLRAADLYCAPELAPICIREGALNQRRADGGLIVSPDHRMLIRKADAGEYLVAATDLIDGKQVVRDQSLKAVTYVHLMLEHHHVVLANGFETESFHPAAAPLDQIPEPARMRLFDVMPDLQSDPSLFGSTARPVLSRAEAGVLAA